MYALYKELHPPTGVEHCASGSITDRADHNIVTAAGSTLRVYKLRKTLNGSEIEEHLEQVLECELFGNLSSLAIARLPKSKRDAILLAFKDAKLSVVEFDSESHSLNTVSLHYFEDEETKVGSGAEVKPPLVRVDPDHRCAGMLIYNTKLVILPIQQGDIRKASKKSPSHSHSSTLHSYIIDLTTLDLTSVADQLLSVRDFNFLFGYNNPTVSILFETVPTCAGRIATFKDTCCFVTASLDISQKIHAVVWADRGLPLDCFKLLPVPKPLGGILVFTVNSLIYFSQSYPHFGISTNSLAEKISKFAYRSKASVVLTLDSSRACFMAPDQLLLTLKNGQIYMVSMVTESPGRDMVRGITFDLMAASVQSSSVCKLSDEFIFLGSHLGNSLLLQCTQKLETMTEPLPKRKRISSSTFLDEFDLELFGSGVPTTSLSTSYTFKVCDSIINTAPITNITMGETANIAEEFSAKDASSKIELVCCSGYGKNGSLCILQRGIKPQIVSTFELPGYIDMFTLLSPAEYEGASSHSYLILSADDHTMVLQTGEEMAEVDQSGFVTEERTVFAGNICNNEYNIQVTTRHIVMLEKSDQIQKLSIPEERRIYSCSIADPFLVVLLDNGAVKLFKADHISKENSTQDKPCLVEEPLDLHKESKIVCISAYTDRSGLFVTESSLDGCHGDDTLMDVQIKQEPIDSESGDISEFVITKSTRNLHSTLDDEDELLYGSSDITVPSLPSINVKSELKSSTSSMKEEVTLDDPVSTRVTHWCAVGYDNGTVEICQLPQFEVVFVVTNFTNGPKTLKDSRTLVTGSPVKTPTPQSIIKDLILLGMGPNGEYPYLMSVVDERFLVYKAVKYPQVQREGELTLQVHFVKQHHGVMLRVKKTSVKPTTEEGTDKEGTERIPFKALLRPFDDISANSGVFLCGDFPHWLVLGRRGALHAHPMYIDGAVKCFATFNNQNCPKGFLYFNSEGELRISVLPSQFVYDHYWPIKKVPLKVTPHFIGYLPESKVYAVVLSEPFTVKAIPKVVNEEVESMDYVERDKRFPYPTDEKFYLKLYQPDSWEPLPKCNLKCDDYEHVSCMKVVQLRSQEAVSGMKNFIAVSTCDTKTDEVSSKGKVIVLDIIDVVPDPDQPQTRRKIKVVGNKEFKSPVTAVDAVDGHLIGCVSQKIYIWQFKDQELTPIAFIDTDLYIHSLSVLKNFIFIADVSTNVKLLRFKSELKTLSVISQDPFSTNVYSVGFAVDGDQLGFIATDGQSNIAIYCHQPEIPESYGGKRLLRRCDLNSGVMINCLFRVRCQPSLTEAASKDPKWATLEKRQTTYFATIDGGIGYILPIPEREYRRFNMLQTKMVQGLVHTAGLNPKAHRLYRTERRIQSVSQKNLLDGQLLWQYVELSNLEQSLLAKQIGTEPHQILNDMMDVYRNTYHF